MSLAKTMGYLDWSHIAGAVLDVFLENQQAEKEESASPASADTWCIVDSQRQQIFERARENWCKRTKLDPIWFPYSVDGVARLYFRFRKRNAQEINNFKMEIDSVTSHLNGLFE